MSLLILLYSSSHFYYYLAFLRNGLFHVKLTQQFAPLVVRYIDLMEHSISQSIEKGFSREKWEPRK
jgi:hypothetical protein